MQNEFSSHILFIMDTLQEIRLRIPADNITAQQAEFSIQSTLIWKLILICPGRYFGLSLYCWSAVADLAMQD